MNRATPVKRQATGTEGIITVSTTQFNQVTEEREYMEIRPFATVPARIGVKCGRTINLGNYESARVDVSVEIPCYVEEVRRVYQDVLAMAEERLGEEVSKITSSMNAEQTVEDLL